jgi:hypothetical protein
VRVVVEMRAEKEFQAGGEKEQRHRRHERVGAGVAKEEEVGFTF